uniref:Secretory carrier-associated membrane protein n=1 Tax=Fagus sylvatica TaxID=28930 RepID=A0A2N9GSR9_FAGSY
MCNAAFVSAEEGEHVLTLDHSNFTDTVSEHNYIVFEFYAPCLFLENNQEYKGPRKADGIVTYLEEQNSPASAEIKSVEDAANLFGEDNIFIVGIFPELSGEEFDNFTALAKKLRSDYDFGHTLDAKLLPRGGGSSVDRPTVRLLKPFDELFVDFQDFHVDALEKFVEEASVPIVTLFNKDPSNHPFVIMDIYSMNFDALMDVLTFRTDSGSEVWVVFLGLLGKFIYVLTSIFFLHRRCFGIAYNLFFSMQIHIGFCILAAVAPPIIFKGKSLAGILPAIDLLGSHALVGIFYFIGFAFFCVESLLSIWVIQQVDMYFRGSGKAAEMKRDAARGTMRAALTLIKC